MIPPRIGKYEISAELGRGGMAVVYRGMDPVIHRPVAIKLVRKGDLDPAHAADILERFKREARAAGSLHHPNVVGIYEYGEDDESAWLVMELVPGKSLRDHMVSGYRPEFNALPEVLVQMLEALDYSHSRGVIHRDIKSANVLISEMGIAKISDFGIARIERSHLTQAGEVMGTPYYMAPEQFDGAHADERSDIYSAAVIVYEVLCGRRPFEGAGGAFLKQVLHDVPPAPSSLEPRLPAGVDAVLLKALAKDPAQRYTSARAFLESLKQAFRPKSTLAGVGALRRAIKSESPVAARPAAAPAAATVAPGAKRPSILFVDDEERVLNALSALFRNDYEIETATRGAQALERLKARRFHVLVSDQRMPEMTGVELLRQARAMAPGTVRLLLTGYSDLAAMVGSVNESEVFRFVSKPWQQEDLKAIVAEAASVALALEAAAARGSTAVRSDAAALIIGEPAIARAARELARGAFPVIEAKDAEEALAALAHKEVAALLCDVDLRSEDPAALLRVLKKESPQTQLLVTSEVHDAELIIRLINEARIFRFLKKPINHSLLEKGLMAALQRYAEMHATPALARTQSAQAGQESVASRTLLERARSLGGRFAAAFRK
ncbi:MAG TPA: protein kinase [Burkholderiales bacterium]|jgi:serine/threonine-protein kinase|nr:protein kinase [Burkholderiales bacterium]